MTLLRLADVHTYDEESHILQGVSLDVAEGSITALLGRNGAGKTTTMRSITGASPARRGAIDYRGRSIDRMAPHEIVRLGIGLVPQQRRIFPSLTVEENLSVPLRRTRGGGRRALEVAYQRFPRLRERRRQSGGTLSGGEQQMLAIARTLMLEPDLLLLDEPTEGLSPDVVQQVRDLLVSLRGGGTTILLVEQIVDVALDIADTVYILERGRVVYGSTPAELRASPALMAGHLGVRR